MKVCTIAEFSNGKSIVAYWSECKEENPEVIMLCKNGINNINYHLE